MTIFPATPPTISRSRCLSHAPKKATHTDSSRSQQSSKSTRSASHSKRHGGFSAILEICGGRALLGIVGLCALLLGGCFPHQPGPKLAHFDSTAPPTGVPAPDFVATTLDGSPVRLQDLVGERPTVLQFGSHSCPVYRYRRFWIEELYEEYGDRVRFIVVYTREAHPVGSPSPYVEREWDPWINRVTRVRVPEPETLEERIDRAEDSKRRLEMPSIYLVDDMANEVWQTYGAASSPAFVIDRNGQLTLRQVWIDPKELKRELDRLLEDS